MMRRLTIPMRPLAGAPLAWLAVAFLGVIATGCPATETTTPCAGEESVMVKMNGSCASGQRTFEVRRTGCTITVVPDSPPGASGGSDGGAGPPLGIPLSGAIDQAESPVRQGGWVIWGCLSGNEPCAGQFRFCSTRRTAFQLDMSCLDDTGALACEAVLTE